MIASLLLTLAAVSSTWASPTPSPEQINHLCAVDDAMLPLPAGQTVITMPPQQDARPMAIAIGVGTQNYTCNANGNYTSIGAVALLYDISCFLGGPNFATFKRDVPALAPGTFHLEFDQDRVLAHDKQIFELLGPNPLLLGHHFFVKNPVNASAGISPDFDFSSDSQKGNPNAFIINSLPAKSIPSPDGPDNVAWLQLGNLKGDLAKYVFRVHTTGGQPPAHCTYPSPDITVSYSAQYWFFK